MLTIIRPSPRDWIDAEKTALIGAAYRAFTPLLLRLFLLATAKRRANRGNRLIAAAILFLARQRVRARVRAVAEAREAKRRRVDESRAAGDHVGDEPARARSDAEAVAGKPGGDEKARHRVDRRKPRERIGHHVHHPAPGLGDLDIAERRERLADALARPVENARD